MLAKYLARYPWQRGFAHPFVDLALNQDEIIDHECHERAAQRAVLQERRRQEERRAQEQAAADELEAKLRDNPLSYLLRHLRAAPWMTAKDPRAPLWAYAKAGGNKRVKKYGCHASKELLCLHILKVHKLEGWLSCFEEDCAMLPPEWRDREPTINPARERQVFQS